MSLADPHNLPHQEAASHVPWLTIIGIGEDGIDGLRKKDQDAIRNGAHIIGSKRQLKLIAPLITDTTNVIAWRSPLRPHMKEIVSQKSAGTIVLASGDPFFYGIGASFSKLIPPEDMTIVPATSSLSLALSKLQWRFEDCEMVSLCGRPIESLLSKLASNHKLLALSSDETTPKKLAQLLKDNGFDHASLHLLERLGGPKEAHKIYAPDELINQSFTIDPLHIIAIEPNQQGGSHLPMPRTAGLDDRLFDHDGQITKCEIRAISLAKLAPRPHQLLWDIGLGSGAMSIEWLRLAQGTTAIGFEKDQTRATRAVENAAKFGLTGLTIHHGDILQILRAQGDKIPSPDAIFIGGGLNEYELIERLVSHLKPNGRLVVNGVTTKTEALMLKAFERLGGAMSRIQISHTSPVGSLTAWRPAMPVTQWVYVKDESTAS